MEPGPQLAHVFDLANAGRNEEALALLHQLAAQGDPEALFTLADTYWRGAVVPRDMSRGRSLFAQAARAGHPAAIRATTNLLANGVAGERDWPLAMARLREEARDDTRRAQMLRLIEAMELTADGARVRLPRAEPLSENPRIIFYPGAFSPDECDYLRMIAEPNLTASLVVMPGGEEVRDPVRTSDGAAIGWLIEDPAIHALNRRIAAITGTAPEQGEALLILRYRPGEQYRRHVDWLGGENPRILTALVYLNHDYEGGETEFPKAGLRIKGRKGDALVFRNAGPDGRLDPLTEHAGLPITRGVKYLASRWIREHRHVP